MEQNEFLWSEKYRPKRVEDAILPQKIKTKFLSYVKEGNIPHLLLSGPPGIGKTSVLRAMLEELNCDYQFYNGSLEGRSIDTLRNDIFNYVSAVSLSGGRKYVLLDESDHLNPNSFQPALRSFMDTYGTNVGFLFTCNYPSKIIEALHSRCTEIKFKIDNSEKIDLAYQFYELCCTILSKENITYDETVVASLIQKHFPDWRRVLNELQGYGISGKIDIGILTTFQETSIKKLLVALNDQNFTEVRKWVAENFSIEMGDFYHNLYENLVPALSKAGQPMAILLLAKYEYESAFSINHEINMSACLVDLMLRCKGEWV